MKPAQELLENLHNELARFNPEAPLTMLFDYVKIRFPALDIKHVIKDILKLNVNYMIHEDYGHYSYTEHYCLGDVFVYTSDNEEKGVQLVTTSGAPTLKMLKKNRLRQWNELFKNNRRAGKADRETRKNHPTADCICQRFD